MMDTQINREMIVNYAKQYAEAGEFDKNKQTLKVLNINSFFQ